jgi:hypothetical protein
LTFTAKGGTAVDWVIEGNDDNGTENLFDKDNTEGIEDEYYIQKNTGNKVRDPQYFISAPIAVTSEETYCWVFRITSGGALHSAPTVGFFDSNDNQIGTAPHDPSVKFISFTTPVNCTYIRASVYKIDIDEAMLVSGSTAPDHYIPYQQGVGERTENKFDGNFEQGLYRTYDGTPVGSLRYIRSDKQVISSEEIYTFSFNCPNVGHAGSGVDVWVSFWDANNNYLGYKQETQYTEHTTFTTPENAGYVALFVGAGLDRVMTPTDISDVMLVKGSTAPSTYIPYGYQIPLTVSQQGQTDKNYDIYIGDTPLTEGETVSKTSTGVDIELFEGENVVSTTLYNKPKMEIETSYGVGVKDNNHYIIPFKVNTTIYNIQIGDSPLYDGEYLSYKEKKLYKYIDSVLTPIDPPSPFPEISTTEGVNKVIIETST